MNTDEMKKGAAKGGSAASGDKKRRNLTGIKHRRHKEGFREGYAYGYEKGLSSDISIACMEFFNRTGTIYKAEWV